MKKGFQLKTIYKEYQYFRQGWLFYLMGGICLFLLYQLYRQVVLGISFGVPPGEEMVLLSVTLLMIGITILLRTMRLKTEINQEGVFISFFPFMLKKRHIQWEEIDQLEIRKSVSLAEFGGWGLRYGLNGNVSYTTQGRHGLELHLGNGKKVFLGTQKPEEVEAVIEDLEKEFTLQLLDLKKIELPPQSSE